MRMMKDRRPRRFNSCIQDWQQSHRTEDGCHMTRKQDVEPLAALMAAFASMVQAARRNGRGPRKRARRTAGQGRSTSRGRDRRTDARLKLYQPEGPARIVASTELRNGVAVDIRKEAVDGREQDRLSEVPGRDEAWRRPRP